MLAAEEFSTDLGVGLAVECEEAPAAVYEATTGASVERERVEELFNGALGSALTASEKALRRRFGEIAIGLAGPPCQGHSDLNNHTRRNDPRNALYARVARAAAVLEPKILCVENVPTIRNDRGGVLETTIGALERLGYDVADEVIDMRLIGIPQRRRRHMLIACEPATADPRALLDALVSHPCETHLPRTVGWAIRDLEKLTSDAEYDRASTPTPENRRRIRVLFERNLRDLPNEERPTCHRDTEHTYNSMYGRLRWGAPAQTITGGFGSMGQGRFVHPSRRRTITPHEAARLQTIPDWFDFEGVRKRGDLARMIGNVVPPLLGIAFGRLALPKLVVAVEQDKPLPVAARQQEADELLPLAA